MAARIVMDAGGGPVIGSITLTGAEVNTPVLLSNNDDTGVLGWRWEVVDAPATSPTLNPLPADTFASTRSVTPDIKGHSILVRLTTYLDAARTQIDGTDQKLIRVQFDPPFDWVIPAAGESIEANEVRGWAADVNRILRETWTFIDAGGGGGSSSWNVRQITTSVTVAMGDALLTDVGADPTCTLDLPLITPANLGQKVLIANLFGVSVDMVATPAAGAGQAGLIFAPPTGGPTYSLNSVGVIVLTAVELVAAGGYFWLAESIVTEPSTDLQAAYDANAEITVVDGAPVEVESSAPDYPALRLGSTGVAETDFHVSAAPPTFSALSGAICLQVADEVSQVWQNVSAGGGGTDWERLSKAPQLVPFLPIGAAHTYQVPAGKRVAGVWIAPGAGGGGGGASGGTPHTSGASGGGGGGGTGGQGGGGAALRYVALDVSAETNLEITVGFGGAGGARGDEPATEATAGNPGVAGSDGNDTFVFNADITVELLRAMNPGSGGAGGLPGGAGSVGAGGAGGSVPTSAGVNWPIWRNSTGQLPTAGGAGGAPGAAGTAATDLPATSGAGDIGPTVAIQASTSGLGGAQQGGVHGGGGGGSAGGSGGLGWEAATIIGQIPSFTVGQGGDGPSAGLNGRDGVAGGGGGGASGVPGNAGTHGRGGGGGSGGGGGGHAASATATSNEGGTGNVGSDGCVILLVVSAE